jgi:nucleotide-binding universal stress UspA family protein
VKILVPLDGTTESEAVLPWACAYLALPEARLHLLHVSPLAGTESTATGPDSDWTPHDCKAYVAKAAARLGAWAVRAETHVEFGAPAPVILRRARDLKVDLVAMRSRCRQGVSRILFGSTAAEVLQGSRVPLLVAGPEARPRDPAPAPRNVLIPVDGSDWSAQILEDAAALARRFQGRVTLLHAGKADPRIKTWAEGLAQRGVPATVSIVPGHPATAILSHVSLLGVDLVAMATHGRSGVQRLLLGSVAEEVLRSCPTPVLLRRPA